MPAQGMRVETGLGDRQRDCRWIDAAHPDMREILAAGVGDGQHFLAKEECPAGCSKRLFSKAAASEDPEAYPLGYVEDLNDARTMLADFFSIR